MFGNRKYKGSSAFLKGAKTQFQTARTESQLPDSAENESVCSETDILAAVVLLESPTVKTLADALKCPPSEVSELIKKLSAEGFVKSETEADGSPLKLSEIGKRALRYSEIAKF